MLAYILQYTGINAVLFEELPDAAAYPLGRVVEVIPYMGVGILFGLFAIPEKVEKKNSNIIKYIIACGFVLIICSKIGLLKSPKGFGYSGIALNVISSCLFMLFFSMNVLIKKYLNINHSVLRRLDELSGLTLGVYCMHVLVGKVFGDINSLFPICIDGGVLNCCIIFALSITISAMISNAPCDFLKKLVK